jgi:hypothetical protein
LGDGIAAAKIEKRNASVIRSSGLGQTPQNLDRFLGRVSSYLIHADENGRVLGWIDRDHRAEDLGKTFRLRDT